MWRLLKPTNTQIVAGRMVLMGIATRQYYHSVTAEEGDTISDAYDTVIYVSTMAALSVPWFAHGTIGRVITSPSVLVVVVPVVVGGGISYMIDDEEGLDNYIDFMFTAVDTSFLSVVTKFAGPVDPTFNFLSEDEQGVTEEDTPALEILIPEIQENVFPKREPLVLPDSALGWYMLAIQTGARYLH